MRVLILALGAPSIAHAAEMTVLAQEDGKDRPPIISIKGKLNKGDEQTFRNVIGITRSAVVFLKSPGGIVGAGVAIGLTIKSHGFATAVADNAVCTWACALAWLGSIPRRMGNAARVGFHATLSRECRA